MVPAHRPHYAHRWLWGRYLIGMVPCEGAQCGQEPSHRLQESWPGSPCRPQKKKKEASLLNIVGPSLRVFVRVSVSACVCACGSDRLPLPNYEFEKTLSTQASIRHFSADCTQKERKTEPVPGHTKQVGALAGRPGARRRPTMRKKGGCGHLAPDSIGGEQGRAAGLPGGLTINCILPPGCCCCYSSVHTSDLLYLSLPIPVHVCVCLCLCVSFSVGTNAGKTLEILFTHTHVERSLHLLLEVQLGWDLRAWSQLQQQQWIKWKGGESNRCQCKKKKKKKRREKSWSFLFASFLWEVLKDARALLEDNVVKLLSVDGSCFAGKPSLKSECKSRGC